MKIINGLLKLIRLKIKNMQSQILNRLCSAYIKRRRKLINIGLPRNLIILVFVNLNKIFGNLNKIVELLKKINWVIF